MKLPTLDFDKKRPTKKQSVSFIVNQFAALQAGVPGATRENIKAQIGFQNAYLYENEVKQILEDKESEEGFNAKDFIGLLRFCECVKQGSTAQFGEGLVRINSVERIKQVVNNLDDLDEVVELTTQLVSIRDKINPKINLHASIGLAIKNKKVTSPQKPVLEVGGEVPTENESEG